MTRRSAAKARGLEVRIYPADRARYRRSAGPRRNATIVESPVRVIAFRDGKSRGTLSAIGLAGKFGFEVEVYGPDGEVFEVEGK